MDKKFRDILYAYNVNKDDVIPPKPLPEFIAELKNFAEFANQQPKPKTKIPQKP